MEEYMKGFRDGVELCLETYAKGIAMKGVNETIDNQFSYDTISDDMYEEQTRLFYRGIAEAGEDYAKYYYMSLDRFLKEREMDEEERIIYKNEEGKWFRKFTNMPVWVVGQSTTKMKEIN
jgi:hypothetical protein